MIAKILNINKTADYTKPECRNMLRYGKVILLTDSDDDGIHIKSLLLNYLFETNSTLFDINFIETLNTPIIRVYDKKGLFTNFYTEHEFEEYSKITEMKNKIVKYYKGLGSHAEGLETKDCFTKKQLNIFNITEECGKEFQINFQKGFEKKRQTNIIECLKSTEYINKLYLELPINGDIYCKDYLKLYLNNIFYVNILKRHIPNFTDGLKDSQRKICYTVLKKVKGEIKIERLSGKVSEFTKYHHGSKSLEETINNLAQSHVGSNNIPYFKAHGRVGTRQGDDEAQPRYVSVSPNSFYDDYFFVEDITEYNIDENEQIDPVEFYPPIPYYLINGNLGIATGFKSEIYPYNLEDIKECIKLILGNKDLKDFKLIPYFKDWKGSIDYTDESCQLNGIITEIPYGFHVTEIPATMLIKKFKALQNKLVKSGEITKVVDNSTNHIVDSKFKSKLTIDQLITKLKLKDKISLRNIVVLKDKIPTKYSNAKDLLVEFVQEYLKILSKRKNANIKDLDSNILLLQEKLKFIIAFHEDKIDIKLKTSELIIKLKEMKFIEIEPNFTHLLSMSVTSLLKDQRDKLQKKINDLSKERDELQIKSEADMYLELID
jgi:DNA topoisomerase II